jgi:hypothetical protein
LLVEIIRSSFATSKLFMGAVRSMSDGANAAVAERLAAFVSFFVYLDVYSTEAALCWCPLEVCLLWMVEDGPEIGAVKP